MRRYLVDAVKALVALALLVVLLGGVPWALSTFVGWPLPRSVPTFGELGDGLSGNSISDTVIIKALAVVCWLAWTQLVACTLVELGSWLRGRAAPSLPVAGLLQPAVRRLVLCAVLLLGTTRSASHRPLPLLAAPTAVLAAHPGPLDQADSPGARGSDGASAARSSPGAVAAATKKCVVKPRDSLWRLAESHLGDGMRWRELADLNLGVPQPDGRVLRDPNLIRPGWVLAFPADAVGLDEPAVTSAESASLPPASIPETQAPPPLAEAPPPPPADLPAAAVTAPAPLPEAPLARLPVVPAPVATVPAPQSTKAPRVVRLEPNPAEGSSREGRAGSRDGLPIPAPFQIAGGSLLAAGVVRTVLLLRRVQQRHRRPGRTIPVPTERLAEAEVVLRRAASRAPADRLDLALRALAGCLAQRKRGSVPGIEAVSVDSDGIEILFGGPVRVPHGPFEVSAGGRSWTLPPKSPAKAVAGLAEGTAAPCPALVAVGHVEGKEILIDVESPARTSVSGAPAEVASLLEAIALGLATSTWADDLKAVVVGEASPGLDGLDRVVCVPSIEAIIDDLEVEVEAVTKELAAIGCASTLSARAAPVADTWTPTVVVLRDSTAAAGDAIKRLLEIAGRGHGLGVVGASLPESMIDRELVIEDSTLLVRPPGLAITPLGAADEPIREAGELLELAQSEEEGEEALVPLEGPPTVQQAEPEQPDLPPVRNLSFAAPAEGVFVGVLGAVEIQGGARPIDRRKSKELVVYLALHPRGVDEGRIKAALWPNAIPSGPSFNQTVSKARSSLGIGPGDNAYLPNLTDGLYRVQGVANDLDQLSAALRRANDEPGEQSMEALAAALGLVRGLPFEGTKDCYEWAYAEGFAGRVSAVVADAAHLAAEWAIARGDTGQALWAAAQGLLASPGDEVLFRDRMRAYDAAGNPAGVESVMSELCRVVEALEPYDSLHPETKALYAELSRGRTRRAG